MTHASREFADRPSLEYPFGDRWSPEPGQPFEVAEGVYWLRVPMPMSLDHINLWILKDGASWVIVDSGMDAPQCRQVWENVFDHFLSPHDVSRIIITHLHPDHTGLASWLAHRCECRIHISQGELDLYQRIFVESNNDRSAKVLNYLQQAGFNQTETEKALNFFTVDEKPKEMRIQRDACDIIADGDELIINNRSWRMVMGNGHSPEHMCLYCAELGIMISGDQALPRISSNVSVYPESINKDPLHDWLSSCEKLRTHISDNTLILPSHQEPFYGLHARMDQLVFDHHVQLNRLRSALDSPASAVALTAVLFPRELQGVQTVFATGETLAHLNYLLNLGEISRNLDADGVIEYRNVN